MRIVGTRVVEVNPCNATLVIHNLDIVHVPTFLVPATRILILNFITNLRCEVKNNGFSIFSLDIAINLVETILDNTRHCLFTNHDVFSP